VAQDSQNVRKSIHLTPHASPDLSQTGDLGVDSSDSNRLQYNPGTGAERVALQQDVTAEATTRAAADTTIQTQVTTNTSNLSAHTGASSGVHGVTGSVVGTTDSQTLTNKTLTSPVINTPTADTITGISGGPLALTAQSGQNVNVTTAGAGVISINGVQYNISNQIISANSSDLEVRAKTGQNTKINAFTGNVLLQNNNITQATVVSTGIELASGKTLTVNGGGSIVPPTSGTITVPAATDTLVGKATTDTLTNKTLAAGSNTITGLTNSNLSGSAGITIANGGTGAATKAAAFDALSPMTTSGDVIYGGTSGTGTRLAKGSDGQILTLASGLPSWGPPGLTNPMTTAGDVIYGGASGVATRLAIGSTGAFLQATSSTTVGWVSDQAYTSTLTGTMTTTSTTIADLTVSSLVNTAVTNISWPSVSIAGASAGWTFTPTRLGILKISVNAQMNPSANSNSSLTLTDGSNTALSGPTLSNHASSGAVQTVTVRGFINVTSLSAVTIKLRASISSGTLTVLQTTISVSY
jgi:hypothetical protein